MPGVYSHGKGQYSDQAGGMGFKPGFTGQPNAQNMQAAESLARGCRPGMDAAAVSQGSGLGFSPSGVTAPTVLHSGNSWQARNDLRNLAVSASSITNRPEWQSGSATTIIGSTRGKTGKDDPHGNIAAYQTALGADIAARGAQPGFDMQAARENAATMREGLQQDGANQRAGMQQSGETGRAQIRAGTDAANTQIGRDRLGMEQTAQGFKVREAERMEKLRNSYDAAKTDGERSAIAKQLRELQGNAQESPWKVQVTPTAKNADGSTSEGSIYRYNGQTGQVERVDGGAAQPLANNKQAIAIRDHPSLSREQKAEALRKLGY